MRFTIQREAFLKALRAVAGVVERRQAQTSPILSHVLLRVTDQRIILTATDQEVELVADAELEGCEEKGEITIPFRKLMDLCRALPEGVLLSVVEEQDRILIRAGRSRFTLSTLPAADFPSLSPNALDLKFVVSKKMLRQLIDNTAFAMAEQDVRYYLNGMLLEVKAGELFAVAADGHRLAISSTRIQVENTGQLRIIVPRKGVLELQRILDEVDEEISLVIGTHHLRVIMPDISMTTKLLEGKFPDYERIIPRGGNKIVIVARHMLKEAFQRAAALFSDKFRGIRLHLSSGRLRILAINTEQEEVEEDLEIEYQGEALEIGFNVKYLIDFLSVIQTEGVQFTFSDANNSARVEAVGGAGSVYVIMPMRI